MNKGRQDEVVATALEQLATGDEGLFFTTGLPGRLAKDL